MTQPRESVMSGGAEPRAKEPAISSAAAQPAPGERERLKAMFEAHYDLVWRVLRRVGLSASQADDGAQQVFIIASRRLADIESGKERAFLCATAMKLAPRIRSAHGREELSAAPPEQSTSVTPDEVLELKQRRALLERILGEMEEDLRTVLVLTEIEGLSKREVAEALEIPEGTAASRLRRAREDFQARLKRHGGTP